MLHILTKLLISTISTNIRTQLLSQTLKHQVSPLRSWLKLPILEMASIKSDQLLTTQNNQQLGKEILNSISQHQKLIGNCLNKPTLLITTSVGRRIQDLEFMISIRWVRSSLTHLDKIKFSRVTFQIAKIRKKGLLLQDQERIKLLFQWKKKLRIILETILTVCSLVRSPRVSSLRRKEVNSGSMKGKHLTPDKPSLRIQDLVNMNTRKRKTISKTKSFKRRPSTQPSTAAILDQ